MDRSCSLCRWYHWLSYLVFCASDTKPWEDRSPPRHHRLRPHKNRPLAQSPARRGVPREFRKRGELEFQTRQLVGLTVTVSRLNYSTTQTLIALSALQPPSRILPSARVCFSTPTCPDQRRGRRRDRTRGSGLSEPRPDSEEPLALEIQLFH